jgi:predicted esterase
VDQTERIEKLMDIELEYYFDKNPKRIFLGGITNGASIALATYLRYNRDKPLGGVMSLYGINPIQDVSKFTSEVTKYS